MTESLIGLLILCVVVGIFAWLALYVLSALPLPAPFGRIAHVLVIVIAVLIVLLRAMTIFGVAI